MSKWQFFYTKWQSKGWQADGSSALCDFPSKYLAQKDLHRNPFYAWFLRNGVLVWVCVWKSSTFFPTTNAASDTAHRKFNFFVSDLMLFHVFLGDLGEKKTSWVPVIHWINGNKPSGVHIFLVGMLWSKGREKSWSGTWWEKNAKQLFCWRIWRSQPSDSSTHITVGPWEGKRHEVTHHQRKLVVPSGWRSTLDCKTVGLVNQHIKEWWPVVLAGKPSHHITSSSITHMVRGTGIFTYMNGWCFMAFTWKP